MITSLIEQWAAAHPDYFKETFKYGVSLSAIATATAASCSSTNRTINLSSASLSDAELVGATLYESTDGYNIVLSASSGVATVLYPLEYSDGDTIYVYQRSCPVHSTRGTPLRIDRVATLEQNKSIRNYMYRIKRKEQFFRLPYLKEVTSIYPSAYTYDKSADAFLVDRVFQTSSDFDLSFSYIREPVIWSTGDLSDVTIDLPDSCIPHMSQAVAEMYKVDTGQKKILGDNYHRFIAAGMGE